MRYSQVKLRAFFRHSVYKMQQVVTNNCYLSFCSKYERAPARFDPIRSDLTEHRVGVRCQLLSVEIIASLNISLAPYMHVDYMLLLRSQRMFAMKRLRDDGLAKKYLCRIFQAIVTRILYPLPAWGVFLSKELSGRIYSYLRRCYRY